MPNKKINPRSLYIPPQIFQIPQDKVWIRIPAFRFLEAIKIEKWPVLKKDMEQQSGAYPAGKAGDDAYRKHRISQGSAVDDQLRIQQYRTHHKCSQPVVFHPSFGKSGRYGYRPIHTERRSYAKDACSYDPDDTKSCLLQGTKGSVDLFLSKYGYSRTDHHAQHPVMKDLLELYSEIVPEIYKFALHHLCGHVLSSFIINFELTIIFLKPLSYQLLKL